MPVEATDRDVTLTHPSNPKTEVKILNYGATVFSWKVDDKPQIWLSDAAKMDGSKPVRGGIPLVFPNFGKLQDPGFAELPQHGFARNSEWEFLGQVKECPPTVQFALSPEQANPDVYAKWGTGDHDFTLIYTIELGEQDLKTKIEVSNTDKKSWKFNWLFHTYLYVDDITDIVVNNLAGDYCYDQLVAEHYHEKAPMISFTEEFDRIYKNVDTSKVLQTVELGKVNHTVKRVNLPDVVVWNPWVAKSASMADFEPKSGFHKMLCIEPGHVADFVTLQPGETWTAEQIISKNDEINLQSV